MSLAITFFLAKFSDVTKREIKMAKICVCVCVCVCVFFPGRPISTVIFFGGEISSDFSNGFKHVPRGILNFILLSYPVYSQIWLNFITDNRQPVQTYITIMKNKPWFNFCRPRIFCVIVFYTNNTYIIRYYIRTDRVKKESRREREREREKGERAREREGREREGEE